MDLFFFRQEVYSVVAAIPCGRVLTYAQVACLAGSPRHARMVGRIMHDIAADLHLPCHRVVNSLGRTAPFWAEQRQLLEAEGVSFKKNGCVDLKKCQWRFADE